MRKMGNKGTKNSITVPIAVAGSNCMVLDAQSEPNDPNRTNGRDGYAGNQERGPVYANSIRPFRSRYHFAFAGAQTAN